MPAAKEDIWNNKKRNILIVCGSIFVAILCVIVGLTVVDSGVLKAAKDPTGMKNVIVTSAPSRKGDRRNHTIVLVLSETKWKNDLENRASKSYRHLARSILEKVNAIGEKRFQVGYEKTLLTSIWRSGDNVGVNFEIIFRCNANQHKSIQSRLDENMKQLWSSNDPSTRDFGMKIISNEKMTRLRRQIGQDEGCGTHKKLCNDGSCVFRSWWCNGQADCPDESDEINCSNNEQATDITSAASQSTTTPYASEYTSNMNKDNSTQRAEYTTRTPLTTAESQRYTTNERPTRVVPQSTAAKQDYSLSPPSKNPNNRSSGFPKEPAYTTSGNNESEEYSSGTPINIQTDPTSTPKSKTKIYVPFDVDGGLAPEVITTEQYQPSSPEPRTNDDFSCRAGSYMCDNGDCIPRSWVCDNVTDCSDWSDETEGACDLPPVMNHPGLESVGVYKITQFAGRAAVRYNGSWGNICDDYWDKRDADVFCRTWFNSTGIKTEGFTRKNSYYRPANGLYAPILLDAVDCMGHETNLSYCAGPPLGQADCSTSETASVLCQPNIDGIRLVNGNNARQGRIQLLVNGAWGTICDRSGWDEKAAQVICRMLNFTGPAYNTSRSKFGSPTGVDLVVGSINCTGLEDSIKDCWASSAGQGVVGDLVTECKSHMAAGVSCGIKICKSGEILCSDLNTCVAASLVCDGLWDCPATCRADQFACDSYKRCINMTQRCDGSSNCDDGADERSCVMKREGDGIVVAFDRGSMMPICYTPDVETGLGESVCRSLGMRGLIEIIPTDNTEVGVEVLKTVESSSLLGFSFQQQQTCRVFKVDCFDDGCGIRGPRFVAPFVNNGKDAAAGEWRWQIRLVKDGKFACGGSILTPRHIITANHCVRSALAGDLQVQVGKFSSVVRERSEEVHTVKKITSNPRYYLGFGRIGVHDVAILELDNPIEISRFAGSVCLPDNNTDLTISENCFITGWGRNEFGDLPTVLQETRVNVINHTVCNQLYSFTFVPPLSSMVCVDHPSSTGSAPNKGDSGGPLVCEDSNGRWVLMGITGYITWETGVYHKVQYYLDWIKTQLTKDCDFVCDWNTKCLTREQICDRTTDCIDGTDETVHCGGNCTFELKNTCGYRIRDEGVKGWRLSTLLPRGKSVLQHWFGSSTAQIVSPPLDTSLPGCLVLQITRDLEDGGRIGSGTSLTFETVEAPQNRSTVFWNLPIQRQMFLQQNISDNVSLFTLTSDVKQIEQYNIYNIQLLPGNCPSLVCNESTTPCDDMTMCIPEAHVCNGLPQCPDGSDEKNCTSFVSVSCTFRHQYYCGYGPKDSPNIRHWDNLGLPEYPGGRFTTGLSSAMIEGFIAPLFSPIFSVDVPSCYLFDFILPNRTSTYLNVSVLDMSSNETQIVWAQKYYRGNIFRLGHFDLFPGRYRVYFNTESSSVKLSRIDLRPRPCLQDVYSCSLDEFTCMDGQCISEDLSCDDSPNCNDQSDLNRRLHNLVPKAPKGILRIADESIYAKGLVQVQINNRWEFICLPLLYSSRSHLRLCNFLGYREWRFYRNSTQGRLPSVQYDCFTSWQPAQSCFRTVSACSPAWFLQCSEPKCFHPETLDTHSELIPRDRIRLQDGASKNEGRVEVLFNNTWGTVCDRTWTASTAVCRTLGFRGQSISILNTNPGTGRIWLDKTLLCDDTEQLFDCEPQFLGVELSRSCTHYNDVAVQCSPGCLSDQAVCGDGKTCIESNSLCDGENDCPDGDDEKNCASSCQTNQFVCDRYSICLSMSSTCDGIMDCQDGTDEFNCVILSDNGVAMIVMVDGLYPVCNGEQIDGDQLSNMLCKSMGERGAYGFEIIEETEQGIHIVDSTRPLLPTDKTLVRGCNTIKPLCLNRDCGRSNPVLNIQAVKDEWTGQVSLMSSSGAFVCIATLIASNIFLATEDCARRASYGLLDGRRLEWNNSNTESPFVLFHLTEEVSGPVCLPDPSTEIVNKCSLVETKYDPQYGKSVLQQVKVKTYNWTECSKKFPTLNVTDRMICASLGTERSPICNNQTNNDMTRLLCKDIHGFWILMGLFANQPFECVMENELENVAVFHSIRHYVQQISNQTDCPFQCDDIHCIAASKVCDGVYDCVDKSDETRFCNVTCDFEEDPFVCGFQFTVGTSGWDVTSGSRTFRDHTVRSNSTSSVGHYILYSNTSQTFRNDSALLSPAFAVSSESCLEFYYLMPSSEVDLFVEMEDLNSETSVEVFSGSNRQGNRWRLAQISLPPGRYRVHFHPTAYHSSFAIGLDDFTLREGSCPVGDGRYRCYSCSYNDHAAKRGVECMTDPANSTANANWAVRCPLKCVYTTTVNIQQKQLLAITRGCAEYIGPNGCTDAGPYQYCRYMCTDNLCNGGLSGVLVEKPVNTATTPISSLQTLIFIVINLIGTWT